MDAVTVPVVVWLGGAVVRKAAKKIDASVSFRSLLQLVTEDLSMGHLQLAHAELSGSRDTESPIETFEVVRADWGLNVISFCGGKFFAKKPRVVLTAAVADDGVSSSSPAGQHGGAVSDGGSSLMRAADNILKCIRVQLPAVSSKEGDEDKGQERVFIKSVDPQLTFISMRDQLIDHLDRLKEAMRLKMVELSGRLEMDGFCERLEIVPGEWASGVASVLAESADGVFIDEPDILIRFEHNEIPSSLRDCNFIDSSMLKSIKTESMAVSLVAVSEVEGYGIDDSVQKLLDATMQQLQSEEAAAINHTDMIVSEIKTESSPTSQLFKDVGVGGDVRVKLEATTIALTSSISHTNTVPHVHGTVSSGLQVGLMSEVDHDHLDEFTFTDYAANDEVVPSCRDGDEHNVSTALIQSPEIPASEGDADVGVADPIVSNPEVVEDNQNHLTAAQAVISTATPHAVQDLGSRGGQATAATALAEAVQDKVTSVQQIEPEPPLVSTTSKESSPPASVSASSPVEADLSSVDMEIDTNTDTVIKTQVVPFEAEDNIGSDPLLPESSHFEAPSPKSTPVSVPGRIDNLGRNGATGGAVTDTSRRAGSRTAVAGRNRADDRPSAQGSRVRSRSRSDSRRRSTWSNRGPTRRSPSPSRQPPRRGRSRSRSRSRSTSRSRWGYRQHQRRYHRTSRSRSRSRCRVRSRSWSRSRFRSRDRARDRARTRSRSRSRSRNSRRSRSRSNSASTASPEREKPSASEDKANFNRPNFSDQLQLLHSHIARLGKIMRDTEILNFIDRSCPNIRWAIDPSADKNGFSRAERLANICDTKATPQCTIIAIRPKPDAVNTHFYFTTTKDGAPVPAKSTSTEKPTVDNRAATEATLGQSDGNDTARPMASPQSSPSSSKAASQSPDGSSTAKPLTAISEPVGSNTSMPPTMPKSPRSEGAPHVSISLRGREGGDDATENNSGSTIVAVHNLSSATVSDCGTLYGDSSQVQDNLVAGNDGDCLPVATAEDRAEEVEEGEEEEEEEEGEDYIAEGGHMEEEDYIEEEGVMLKEHIDSRDDRRVLISRALAFVKDKCHFIAAAIDGHKAKAGNRLIDLIRQNSHWGIRYIELSSNDSAGQLPSGARLNYLYTGSLAADAATVISEGDRVQMAVDSAGDDSNKKVSADISPPSSGRNEGRGKVGNSAGGNRGGAVVTPSSLPNDIARLHAMIEKSGGSIEKSVIINQIKTHCPALTAYISSWKSNSKKFSEALANLVRSRDDWMLVAETRRVKGSRQDITVYRKREDERHKTAAAAASATVANAKIKTQKNKSVTNQPQYSGDTCRAGSPRKSNARQQEPSVVVTLSQKPQHSLDTTHFLVNCSSPASKRNVVRQHQHEPSITVTLPDSGKSYHHMAGDNNSNSSSSSDVHVNRKRPRGEEEEEGEQQEEGPATTVTLSNIPRHPNLHLPYF